MKHTKFFCDECGTAHSILEEKYGAFYCSVCDTELFESAEELMFYLDYPEVTGKIPFEKSKKMRDSKNGGRAHGN